MLKLKKVLVTVFAVSLSCFLFACGGGGGTSDETPALSEFTGITFESKTVTYDGDEHELLVEGNLPAGTNVQYTNNKATEVGVYNATAVLSKEGYTTKTLNATLTIEAAALLQFSGLSFDNKTVTYNGSEHKIEVVGNVPEGTNVQYTNNKATNAGTYGASVTLSKEGYQTKTLTATLVINKADFSGLSLTGETYTYDGQSRKIEVAGVPTGANVVYTYNNQSVSSVVNAGTYQVKAVVSKANYNDKTLTATLVINKATITQSIEFDDLTVEYDALPHSISIVGNIPTGTEVSYTYNGESVDEVTEVGEYTVVATISGANYVTKTLTAKLTIKSTEEQLYSVYNNGVVYFQNNLDGNKLYKVTTNGVTKVNNDVPEYMISNNGTMYYYSTSLFSKNIKSFNGTLASNLYSTKGEYLTTDGTYIYYAINNLVLNTDQNGIYKIALDGSSDAPIRLTTDKAQYLCYYDGYIYYANASDGKALSKISVNANNGTSTKLFDEKVEYIIVDNGALYFNSTDGLLGGSAIRKYVISSNKCIKLTTDSGKYLTKVGSYIYYVNDDLLTGSLFGKNICKVSALATSDSSLPGAKVIVAENNAFSSLSSDGENLYYYKLNDKHFYSYDLSSEEEVDLMEDFELVVESATPTGYAIVKEYNGYIYYTDVLDASCLYRYNPQTKSKVKILSDSVAGVWFNGNYMYYSSYILTNFALNRLDLTTNEIVKINSDRCENLIFEGTDIYYTKVSLAGNNICKLDKDGVLTEIYNDKNVSIENLIKIGNDFYFVINPKIGKQLIYKYTIGDKNATNLDLRAINIELYNSTIYYYDGSTSAIKSCALDGTNEQTLISGVDVTDFYVKGSNLYYSSKKSGKSGLYKVNLLTKAETKISDKQGHGLCEVNGKVYFIETVVTFTADYPIHSGNGEGYLYYYDGSSIKKA